MPKRLEKRLDALKIKALNTPGRHADGGNLYLVVDKSGAKRWVFLFRWNGKLKEMGLGGLTSVSLAKARERATKARECLSDGKNPIDEGRAAALAARAKRTFGEVADEFLSSQSQQWRNAKHQAQWAMTLSRYAGPLRDRPVDEIDTAAVLEVLQPIWQSKSETADRVRGRIERVLDAAKAKGERTGDNPARWRHHLDHLLPKRQKLTRGHHAAMPYAEVPTFMVALRERDSVAVLGLEFLILTAARSGEVLGATWDEFDLNDGIWTIPAQRMKAGREHRVPLVPRALAILERIQTINNGPHVFPGKVKDKPLSAMSFEMLLRRMKVQFTTHGFRSSFRDWAGEVSTFQREVAEAALAHTVGDATERAYRRGDALEKRRKLMDAWASYLEAGGGSANVVPLRTPRA